jgi:hypothetical protein
MPTYMLWRWDDMTATDNLANNNLIDKRPSDAPVHDAIYLAALSVKMCQCPLVKLNFRLVVRIIQATFIAFLLIEISYIVVAKPPKITHR